MAIPAPRHHYSFADYLAVEAMSVVRHEFLNGAIYAMAGGSALHAALAMAAGARLLDALRGGPCRVFSSDLRVRVRPTGLATYPDVTVVCGDVSSDPDSRETVANPLVVVEVLSDSTMEYDLGDKFEHYRQIESLRAVVYVWQSERRIEVRRRGADGSWASASSGPGDGARIDALGCGLEVDGVYADAGAGG
jgi:Uma2 family endonuclease